MESDISELVEWLGVSEAEVKSLLGADVNALCQEEWNEKKDIYSFHKTTKYFIATLWNWELTTKSSYTDQICKFINNWRAYRIRTVLDHGVGIGYDAIRILEETDVDIYLYELDSLHLDFAIWRLKKRDLFSRVRGIIIPTAKNPLPEFPLVDFISSMAVIEHLEYPERDLKFLLERARYVGIRVDPMVDVSPTHFSKNEDFLKKLDGQDMTVLSDLGLKRINVTSPPIYEVTENVPEEFRVNYCKEVGKENFWQFRA